MTTSTETAIRVGVYDQLAPAQQAVNELLAHGFTREQITVICSDETREQYFREFEHQDQAGHHAPAAAATGGAIGAALGGLTAIAAGLATGGTALLFTGGAAAWTGAVVGGLVGAMMTRGVEKELADFYDQAVLAGKILVAVEDSYLPRRLVEADEIFARTGAQPVVLPKEE